MDRIELVERLISLVLSLVGDLARRVAWGMGGTFARLSLLSRGLTVAIILYMLARGAAAIGLMGIARGMTSLAGDLLGLVLAAGFMRVIWRNLRSMKVLP